MSILFYGNCQLDVIKETLNIPNSVLNTCFSTEVTEQFKFYKHVKSSTPPS